MIAERFAEMIRWFQKEMGAHLVPAMRTSPLQLLIWNRLTRYYQRFAALHAKWRAGTLPKARLKKTDQRRAGKPSTARTPSALPFPRHFAWLAEICGAPSALLNDNLRKLLVEPDTKEFLAAVPQAARYLRPLAHAVGMKPEESELAQIRLAPRPPRKRRPRTGPPKPRPAKPAPPPPPPPPPDISLVIHGMTTEEFHAKTRQWRFKRRIFEI
jgi:hypothetical protein